MSRFVARLLAMVVSLAGIVLLPQLSYKLVPDRMLPTVSVRFDWPGMNEQNVENMATSKIEGTLAGMEGLTKTFSRSFPGRGEIFLEFDEGTAIDAKKVEAATLIKHIMPGLPEGVSYPRLAGERPASIDTRLISYSLTCSSEATLLEFVTHGLEPALQKIDGVKSVTFEGLPSNALNIFFDPARMRRHGLSHEAVAAQLQSALQSTSSGAISLPLGNDERRMPVVLGEARTIDNLKSLPLGTVEGRIVQLDAIAVIKQQRFDAVSTYRVNGERTVSFSVIADEQANQISLAEDIRNMVEQLSPMSPDVHVQLVHDASHELKEELKSLGWQCLISFVLLSLTTVLFYRNRSFLTNLFVSLGVTLLSTVVLLWMTGIAIHLYSLMALTLSVGFVIDNAIVAIDHYRRSSDNSIILPIIAATLTNIAPLAVIFSLDAGAKLNLIDFAWSLTMALAASLLVSFFLIPAMAPKIPARQFSPVRTGLRRLVRWTMRYRSLLYFLRSKRLGITIGLMVVFGLPVRLLPDHAADRTVVAQVYNRTFGSQAYQSHIKPWVERYLGGAIDRFVQVSQGTDFIDVPQRPRVTVRISAPVGSTNRDVDELCTLFEKKLILNKAAGIDFFRTRILGDRHAQLDVFCLPEVAAEALPQLKGYLEQATLAISGAQVSVSGVGIPYGPSGGEVVDSHLFLSGYSHGDLRQIAQRVKAYLEANPRVQHVEIRSEPSWFASEESRLFITAPGAAGYTLLTDLYSRFNTYTIGMLSTGNELLPVRLIPVSRDNSIHDILSRQFVLNDTTLYKASYSMRMGTSRESASIVKSNQQYQLVVQYTYNGTEKQSTLYRFDIAGRFRKQLPFGFTIRADESEDTSASEGRLLLAMLVAVAAIFTICAVVFESLRKALVLIVIVPLTFTGVLYGLSYLDMGFVQGTFAALILLAGLLVNTCIFLLSEFSYQNRRTSPARAYVKAVLRKFTPVLITSLATVAGLIPFLTYESENTFWHPFAVTTTMGIGFALLVVLLILPIYFIEKRP